MAFAAPKVGATRPRRPPLHDMPPPTSPSPRSWREPALIALLCAIWSSTWWAIRVCLAEQPPCGAAALRFLLAGLTIAAAGPLLRRSDRATPPPAWLWLAAGALNFAGSYGILYVAEQTVPSGIAAVLWAVFPLLMAASGALWLGERLTRRQCAGFVVAFAGICTVFAGDFGDAAGHGAPLAAGLLLLGSPLVSAVGTTLIKRWGHDRSVYALNRNGMFVGALLLGAASLLRGESWSSTWSAPVVTATIYLAVCGTAFTFATYFWLLQRMPANRLSLISYVTPVLAVLLAAVVGDGALTAAVAVGTALVVAGIALVVRKAAP
jgi:drug/metabolite transporter (DMT)-like permease